MINGKKMLVVSAHAADYVWRAGGTIAKYIKHGAEIIFPVRNCVSTLEYRALQSGKR